MAKIDPFQQSTQWLNDGLEVGINSADRDKSKIRRGIIRKNNNIYLSINIYFLSFFLRKKAKSKSKNPYQRPWLPIWPGLKAEPFHDNKPEWTKILERNYPEIKKELFNLIKKMNLSIVRFMMVLKVNLGLLNIFIFLEKRFEKLI